DRGDVDTVELPEGLLGAPEAAEPEQRLLAALGIGALQGAMVDEVRFRCRDRFAAALKRLTGRRHGRFLAEQIENVHGVVFAFSGAFAGFFLSFLSISPGCSPLPRRLTGPGRFFATSRSLRVRRRKPEQAGACGLDRRATLRARRAPPSSAGGGSTG